MRNRYFILFLLHFFVPYFSEAQFFCLTRMTVDHTKNYALFSGFQNSVRFNDSAIYAKTGGYYQFGVGSPTAGKVAGFRPANERLPTPFCIQTKNCEYLFLPRVTAHTTFVPALSNLRSSSSNEAPTFQQHRSITILPILYF